MDEHYLRQGGVQPSISYILHDLDAYHNGTNHLETCDGTHPSLPMAPTTHGLAPSPSQPTRRTKSHIALIMLALCTTAILTSMDAVIVSTALPTISRDLSASNSQYAWIGSAYLLACASSLPIWAKLSDVFGRKPVIIVGNLEFLLGSLVAALARNMPMLIAGRALQGLGGGAIIVLINICLTDLFSLRERGLYIAIYGAVSSTSAGVAPVIGGAFTESLTWRWCFWINLPLDVVAIVLLVLFLDLHNPQTPLLDGVRVIDWPGVVSITGGTMMLLLGLQSGGIDHPWDSAIVIGLIAGGIVTLGIFLLLQWRYSSRPIIPVRIFGHTSSLANLVICFCHGFTYISCIFFLPLYFQVVLGASAIHAGVWLLAAAIPLCFITLASGVFIKMTGHYRSIIRVSAFFLTLGFILFINLPPAQSLVRIILFQIVISFGIGPLFQAPLIALQSTLSPTDFTAANATFAFVRTLSSALGLVAGQVVLQNSLRRQQHTLLKGSLSTELVSALIRNFSAVSRADLAQLTAQQHQLVAQAFVTAFRDIWTMYAAFAALALLASYFVQHKVLSRQHMETKTGLGLPEDTKNGALAQHHRSERDPSASSGP